MRAAIFILLLIVATTARADWVKVAESGDTAYYVDAAAVRDTGTLRRAWVVHDYAKAEPGGVRSRRVHYEINCAGERLRSLAVTEHAEAMGSGAVLNARERESDWLYVVPPTGSNLRPRTPYRPIVGFVCAR